MDPFTLFALANGAVSAVKQGCKLYNEIKGLAGEVKDVLQDLDDQFRHTYKDRAPTVAEKNQYIEEKNRIIELSKKQPDDIYAEIGEHLGQYFESMAACKAIFDEEEKHATEVYTGSSSIGKRALQRVLMISKLEAMQTELREIMVYQSPPELGDLYTRVEKMMQKISEEQSIAITKKMAADRTAAVVKRRRFEKIKCNIWKYSVFFIFSTYIIWLIWAIVQIRIQERPELGRCLIPKGTWPYVHYNNLKWVECELPTLKERK